jgi:hypothetical protein
LSSGKTVLASDQLPATDEALFGIEASLLLQGPLNTRYVINLDNAVNQSAGVTAIFMVSKEGGVLQKTPVPPPRHTYHDRNSELTEIYALRYRYRY